MPPPILVSQPSFPSVLDPITPAIHFYSQEHSSTTAKKKPSFEVLPETSNKHWTAPFRDGLPTPPSDMTGVAYNTLPSSSYGGKLNGMSFHPYPTAAGHARSTFDSSSAMIPQVKSKNYAPVANEIAASEPVPHKKPSSSSLVSRLQIPSSINSNAGNLADFAAQMIR